jgi:hypothetical protein
MSQSPLVLHKGAREITLEELLRVPTPPATASHYPVPFHRTLDITVSGLRDAGFEPTRQKLALLREERFFAVIDLASVLVNGVTMAVALRSSHDASLAYGFVAGNRCFCCDNLALSSDLSIHVRRKHTRNGEARFSEAINRTIREKLPQFAAAEAARIAAMQHREIDDAFAEAFLLRAYQDESLLSPRTLPTALKEWRDPSFHDFDGKNAWRLYNAMTFALAPTMKANPQRHATATIRLGALLSAGSEAANAA